jgi:hypothetical protein
MKQHRSEALKPHRKNAHKESITYPFFTDTLIFINKIRIFSDDKQKVKPALAQKIAKGHLSPLTKLSDPK